MTKDIQKTALRLPRELHAAVKEAAEHNNRTMNAEIVSRLSESFLDESVIKANTSVYKEDGTLDYGQIAKVAEELKNISGDLAKILSQK